VILFFWYSQVTEVPFKAGVNVIELTISNLNKLFLEESRAGNTQALIGKDIGKKGIPHKVQFILTWLIIFLIFIGAINLIIEYIGSFYPKLRSNRRDFWNNRFELTYLLIALNCISLLLAIIILPFISVAYSMDRLFALAIVLLSDFFIIGCLKTSEFLHNLKNLLWKSGTRSRNASNKSYIFLLLIIIPYFLCVTGVVYDIFNTPRAIILNSNGEQFDKFYIHDQDSYAAKWIRNKGEIRLNIIYTDFAGGNILKSQGGILHYNFYTLTKEDENINGYIFLRYYNVVKGKLLGAQDKALDLFKYQYKFMGKAGIYDSGGAELWI
jgi:uncharacterized membrane protein